MSQTQQLYLSGANGVQLAATSYGEQREQTVLLLHGAGQTRHSWRHAGEALATGGLSAITLDTRGHGNSEWPENGDYSIDALIGDLKTVTAELDRSSSKKPILVGASLGGITALLAQGESTLPLFHSLVLVDITPRIDNSGVERIIGFMKRYQHGFASIDDAVTAVAEYQSHRQHSEARGAATDKDSAAKGLKKNLRLAEDGRYYWHWDPRLMNHIGTIDEDFYKRQCDAASKLTLPVLLIRGQQSEIVSEESANELIELVPHARYIDIANAAHMVAGDSNEVFVQALLDFIGV